MSGTKLLQAILDKVSLLEKKVDNGFSDVKAEIKVNRERIDKLGLNLAELADDAPTIKEFDTADNKSFQ